MTLCLWAIRLEHMNGSLNHQNFANYSPNDTASLCRRPESSETRLYPSEISQQNSLFVLRTVQKYILLENQE